MINTYLTRSQYTVVLKNRGHFMKSLFTTHPYIAQVQQQIFIQNTRINSSFVHTFVSFFLEVKVNKMYQTHLYFLIKGVE